MMLPVVFRSRLFTIGQVGKEVEAPIAEDPIGTKDIAIDPRRAEANAREMRDDFLAPDSQEVLDQFAALARCRRGACLPIELGSAKCLFRQWIGDFVAVALIGVPELVAAAGPDGLGQLAMKIAKEREGCL
jgi:hypothetical protein